MESVIVDLIHKLTESNIHLMSHLPSHHLVGVDFYLFLFTVNLSNSDHSVNARFFKSYVMAGIRYHIGGFSAFRLVWREIFVYAAPVSR